MSEALHPHHHTLPLALVGRAVEPLEGLARHAADMVRVWHDRWVTRHHLVDLDDRLLDDIGLTRGDVVHEAEKPFWQA